MFIVLVMLYNHWSEIEAIKTLKIKSLLFENDYVQAKKLII